MSPNTPHYQPVDCEFHDRLEAAATKRRPVRIRFLEEDGTQSEDNLVIADVFARDGEEFVALGTGELVRLDRIVAIDGQIPPHRDAAGCAL